MINRQAVRGRGSKRQLCKLLHCKRCPPADSWVQDLHSIYLSICLSAYPILPYHIYSLSYRSYLGNFYSATSKLLFRGAPNAGPCERKSLKVCVKETGQTSL